LSKTSTIFEQSDSNLSSKSSF